VHISSQKITRRFQQIEAVELEHESPDVLEAVEAVEADEPLEPENEETVRRLI